MRFKSIKLSNLAHDNGEAAIGGVLWEKVFLEISQNLLEKTCARVSFLTKLQALALACNFIKKRLWQRILLLWFWWLLLLLWLLAKDFIKHLASRTNNGVLLGLKKFLLKANEKNKQETKKIDQIKNFAKELKFCRNFVGCLFFHITRCDILNDAIGCSVSD